MKKCPRCNETKSLSDFYKRGIKRPDSSPYCKICQNKYQMKRWKTMKIKAIDYLGGICSDCKNKYPLEVYQFHHRDPNQKEFNWANSRQKTWIKLKEEIDKCDLLCANCHILRHSKDISEYD